MPGIGIIANFNSRIFRSDPARIDKFIGIASPECLLRGTRDDSEIIKAAEAFKAKKIDILAILGGDGTLRLTLTKFFGVYGGSQLPPIAMLRGGTMNTTATSIGIKGSPESLLAMLITKYRAKENLSLTGRNILDINGNYGFIFGSGFYHSFIKIYYERAYPSIGKGFLLLARTAISMLTGGSFAKEIFRDIDYSVTVDGKPLGRIKAAAITCSTIQYIGYGISPYKRALEREDSFDTIIFPNKPIKIVGRLPLVCLGRSYKSKDIINEIAKELVIESDSPIDYQLDGDLFTAGNKLTIRTGPRLSFLSATNFV